MQVCATPDCNQTRTANTAEKYVNKKPGVVTERDEDINESSVKTFVDMSEKIFHMVLGFPRHTPK